MTSKTTSVILSSPKDNIFSYLSDIQNLPKWATEFCKELKKVDGKYIVVSPMGEMFFHIKSDQKTGVIDMYYGSSEDKMAVLSTRVIDLHNNSSEFICTCHQDSSMSNEDFDRQFQSLERELDNLKNQSFL